MGVLDKQVTITFNLRKAVGALIVVSLLLGVFFLGRCTAPPEATAPDVGEKQGISGFFSSLFASKESTDTTNTAVTATVTSPEEEEEPEEVIEEVEEVVEEPEEEVVEEPEEPAETCSDEIKNQDEVEVDCGGSCKACPPESFVTTGYSKASVELTNIQHEWYGGWGKIKRINFKIKNNEDGTITALEGIASFEGYSDEGDVVTKTLPSIHQKIKKGKEQFSNIEVDFAYAEAITDPKNLKISLSLYDEDSEKIVQTSKEFDLTKTVVE